MPQVTRSVIVGVTGAHENTDALEFAIAEARLLGRGITVVHALQPVLPAPPSGVLIADQAWQEVGDSIVRQAEDELQALLGEESVPVATLVRRGSPGVVLSELSIDAALVVLQHQDRSRLHRIVTGSTVASVAAHAHSPVVSVAPSAGRAPSGVIAVGVRADGGPSAVLEAAFAEAAARASSLTVVHGWKVPAAYDDLRAEWSAQDEASINHGVTSLRETYPDVEVRIDVHNDWPPDVLVQAAATADLLVVGRHSGLPMLPRRIGSLARAVVAHASSPVMIVPV